MGKHNAYFGDCKSPCSPPADCKSAGTGKSNHPNDKRRNKSRNYGESTLQINTHHEKFISLLRLSNSLCLQEDNDARLYLSRIFFDVCCFYFLRTGLGRMRTIHFRSKDKQNSHHCFLYTSNNWITVF